MIQWVAVERGGAGEPGRMRGTASSATEYEEKSTLGARLRYAFDKTMAAGPIALIGWLAVVSLLDHHHCRRRSSRCTGIAPEGGEPLGFVEAFWEALMRTLDAGTMGGDAGWAFRLVMLLGHARPASSSSRR